MSFCGNYKLRLENKTKACIENLEPLDLLPSAYSQLAYLHAERGALDSAEYYFRRGVEAVQQIGSDRNFNILNRLLLALVYSKKGDWAKALTIGEEALQDALSQGGIITPICEMILGAIFMGNGNHKEAMKRLENSAALLNGINIQTPLLENGSDTALRIIKSMEQEKFGLKQETVCQEETGSYLFRIQMFGPLRVFHQNEELDPTSWRTVKSRDLLAYLAHQDKPVSTDRILNDLWPDLNRDKASAVFHTTLYYLRRHLHQFTDQEIIIRGAKCYQLRPGSILIDRRQFEEKAQRALKKTMTGASANEIEAAITLYRGDYLEDLDYHWVIPIQEELKNMNSDLKQKLAVYYLQNKMYSRALAHLRQLTVLKPYSEEVLRLLLITLAEMGDLPAVKEQYAFFAKTVLKELGIRPSSKITAFYEELCDIKPAKKHA